MLCGVGCLLGVRMSFFADLSGGVLESTRRCDIRYLVYEYHVYIYIWMNGFTILCIQALCGHSTRCLWIPKVIGYSSFALLLVCPVVLQIKRSFFSIIFMKD